MFLPHHFLGCCLSIGLAVTCASAQVPVRVVFPGGLQQMGEWPERIEVPSDFGPIRVPVKRVDWVRTEDETVRLGLQNGDVVEFRATDVEGLAAPIVEGIALDWGAVTPVNFEAVDEDGPVAIPWEQVCSIVPVATPDGEASERMNVDVVAAGRAGQMTVASQFWTNLPPIQVDVRANILPSALRKGLVLHVDGAHSATTALNLADGRFGVDNRATWAAEHDGRRGVYIMERAGQFVVVPHNPRLAPKDGLTMACWAWVPDWTANIRPSTIMSKTHVGGASLGLNHSQIPEGKLFAFIGTGRPKWSDYEKAFATDWLKKKPKGWLHFATTYDQREVRLYIDGAEVARTELGEDAPRKLAYNVENSFIIGGEAGADGEPDARFQFRGAMDDAMMWERALSPEEIKALVAWGR